MQTGNRTMPHGEEAASSNAASSVDHDRTIVRTVPTEERPQPPVMVKVLSGSLPIRPATTSGRATAASSDAERGPGVRMVGRYEIIEKIGEGAMAAVYRAYDPSIDRPLAIKFLHANLSADPEYRSRFLREARAAGMLSHPNIVTVFDVGEIEGRPYIAMELLDGGPLDEKTKSNERFAVADVMKIGSQLASALDFAHSRGIFHRDIKPSNIVLVAGREQIKVTDFGIAHMAASSHSQATRVGTMIGTPHYMSPEQAMGQKVDARSDLFSVGVVMYELLTGQRPFNADSVVTLVYRIAKEEPRPIESFRNDVPSALRRIVDRCLNKEPNRRYQSGAELVSDLDKLSRQLAEQAAQRGAPRLAPLRRQWSLVVGAVVAVTMAIASSVINRHQQQVMLDQLVGHGASLSRLIATENAAAALSDDWVAVDVSVQDVAKTLRLERLLATDAAGVVPPTRYNAMSLSR